MSKYNIKLLTLNQLILILIILFFGSCKNETEANRIKLLELELREKELNLKERELDFNDKKNKEIKVITKSLNSLFEDNKESIFLIEASNNRENLYSLGSGFFIREVGLGVSNYHVLKDADNAIIHTNNGGRYMISEIVNYDKDLDYIIFKISNSGFNNFKPVKFAVINPKIGEDCFAIGNPRGLTQTLSKGIISGYRGEYIQTTAQITNGSSGGALFNNNGEVIGITTMGFKDADLNFALNTVNFDFFKVNSIIEKPIVQENKNYEQVVVSKIKVYLDALGDNNFFVLNDLFAPQFKRFYNKFDIEKYEAIEEHRKYAETYPNPHSTTFC
ncbi:MAG: trypsin-like peptidase domain-containing protein [Bacteroidetes bacterium]|nr:trypsin-like peptidase domain-containing protein [Bacteroidota bacterium]